MARPIRWLKSRLIAEVVLRVWRHQVRNSPDGAKTERFAMDWFKGKKELFTTGLGFLTLLATTFGLADFVGPLQKVSTAIAAGDATAILVALIGLVMMAGQFFRRIALNREGVTK